METPPSVTLELERQLSVDVQVRRWSCNALRPLITQPAAHAEVEVSFVEAGGISFRVGRKELTARSGAVLLVPAEHRHMTTFMATRAASIKLSNALFSAASDAFSPSSIAGMQGGLLPAPAKALALCRLIADEADAPGPGTSSVAEGLAVALAVEVLRALPGARKSTRGSDKRIDTALDFIAASFADPLSVAQMAHAAGMSRYHFSRRFREIVGHSPYQHLLRVRLRQAAKRLRNSSESITLVALEAGFTDLSRFARMFRDCFGTTPEAYRKHAARIA